MQSRTSEKISNSKPLPIAWPVLNVASVSAGIYFGYCNASGTPIKKEYLESLLVFGPTIAQGSLYAIVGGAFGAVSGKEEGKDFDWAIAQQKDSQKGLAGQKLAQCMAQSFAAHTAQPKAASKT